MGEAVRASVKAPEIKKENPVSQVQKGNFYQQVSSPVEKILILQRTIGNQAVQRLMKSGALQAKLRIGAPGDIYEQEADRVAEQVMRMPDIQPQSVQRKCPKCEEELQKAQGEQIIQKRGSLQTSELTPDQEANINTLRSGGEPLPESARAFFEPRFGHDFSDVRIHTGMFAAESARAVNARAYTVGQDVVFGVGQYAPETAEGKKLLAHELTHVVQQGEAKSYQIQKIADDNSIEKGSGSSEECTIPDIIQNAMPNLRSGLMLQRANCCCCVDDVKIQNISKYRNGDLYGHKFDLVADLEYKETDKAASDCNLIWEEKTNRVYYPTMKVNDWNDMFKLLPTSPTFDPWTKGRKKPCPGKETMTITDPPGANVNLPARTLEFRINVGGSDCGCAKSGKKVTAKQVLEPDGKGGIKTQDFTTP